MKRIKKMVSLLLLAALTVTSLPLGIDASELPDQTLSAAMTELGYRSMALSMEQIEEKTTVGNYLEAYDGAVPGVDYSENRISYMADTREEALRIAECYNAKLDFYEYGFAGAIVDFTDEINYVESNSLEDTDEIPVDVMDLVELSATAGNSMPAIYPSIIHYTVDDYSATEEIMDLDADSIVLAEECAIAENEFAAAPVTSYSFNTVVPERVSGND